MKHQTKVDFSICRLQKRGEEIPPPTYQFVTEEELNDLMVEARQKADKKLQMPPVMDEVRVSESIGMG